MIYLVTLLAWVICVTIIIKSKGSGNGAGIIALIFATFLAEMTVCLALLLGL